MGCPDASELVAYLAGNVRLASDIETHIAACPQCTGFVHRARGLGELARIPLLSGARTLSDSTLEHGSEQGAVVPIGGRVGRYIVQQKIGAGGMGVVYAALDPELDRRVALKVLRGEDDDRGRKSLRLLREARAMARLAHPNVIHVHDVGRDRRGRVFIAMELVEGETLARWLTRGPRAWAESRDVFLGAAQGLAAAHEAGLIHRDFKPDNVLLGHDGRVWVTDFGLARYDGAQPEDVSTHRIDLLDSRTSVTRTGALVGTPAYMAPEQYRHEPADERSDQFAFCVALYEALYGRRPFAGRTLPELSTRVLDGEVVMPPRTSGVPAQVRRALLRGLSVRPSDRFPAMRDLIEALERPSRGRRTRIMMLGSAALLMGLGAPLTSASDRELPAQCRIPSANSVWSEYRSALPESPGDPVVEVLDRHVRAWDAIHRDVCTSEELGHSILAERRLRCLAERRAHLDAVVEMAGELGTGDRTRWVRLVEQLPDPEICGGDVETVLGSGPLPPPELRGAILALKNRMARSWVSRELGRYEDALEEVEAVLREAETLEHPPLIAEALALRGRLHRHLGLVDRAAADLEEAAWVAAEAGHRSVAAHAWVDLAFIEATQRGEVAAARWALRSAQSQADLIDDPLLDEKIWVQRGTLAFVQSDFEAAIDAYRMALKTAKDEQDGLRRSDLYLNLGGAEIQLGRFDDAVVHFRAFIDAYESRFGRMHPDVALGYYNLGAVLHRAGRYEEALEALRRTDVIERDTLGLEHPARADTLGALGVLLGTMERHAEAAEHFEEALRLLEASESPSIHARALTELNLATARAELGDLPSARAIWERARVHAETDLGPTHGIWQSVAATQAEIELAAGDPQAALEAIERALDFSRSLYGEGHPTTVVNRLERAEILARLGRRDEARVSAEQVLDEHADVLGADERRRARLLADR